MESWKENFTITDCEGVAHNVVMQMTKVEESSDNTSKKMEYNMKILNEFTNITNRSINQTKFLLELLDGDFMKLIELEEKIKNNFISYCPGDKESVQRILDMDYGKYWWRIKFVREIEK